MASYTETGASRALIVFLSSPFYVHLSYQLSHHTFMPLGADLIAKVDVTYYLVDGAQKTLGLVPSAENTAVLRDMPPRSLPKVS